MIHAFLGDNAANSNISSYFHKIIIETKPAIRIFSHPEIIKCNSLGGLWDRCI